jgi:hypothetical protein
MSLKRERTLSLILQVYGEKTLDKIEGFDKAIIGIEVATNKLIYSVKKIIKILKKNIPEEEAVDHFYMVIFSENQKFNKAIFCEDYLIKKINI